ncbi:MAG: hypothetical protein ABJP48_00095 [Erythrobacter sp.]
MTNSPEIDSQVQFKEEAMAKQGTGFFDSKGNYFRSPEEATMSDLASILGQIGEGESLAPGIAHTMLQRRADIERLFAEHDEMLVEKERLRAALDSLPAKVSKLPTRPAK